MGKKRTLKEKYIYHKLWHGTFKELKLHYEELFHFTVREFRFERLQNDILMSAIDEMGVVSTDPIIKKLVDMAKERASLDKMIHTRALFPNPEEHRL